MNFRALFLLTAFLLHAGLGLVRVDARSASSFSGNDCGSTNCVSGCCATMMTDDAAAAVAAASSSCGCSMRQDRSPTDKSSHPIAPVSTATRDLIPQVAWTISSTAHLADFTDDAQITSLHGAADREGSRQQGRRVPLTVLHCSFLH